MLLALKNKFLLLVSLFLIVLVSQTAGSKLTNTEVYAACDVTIDFVMKSEDGFFSYVFFTDPRAATAPSGPTTAGQTYIGKIPNVQITLNGDISKTHSFAKISRTDNFTFTYNKLTYKNGTLDTLDPCGEHTVTPIPYDASRDPFPKEKFFEIYLDPPSNTFRCRETRTSTPYTIKSECDLAAASRPPIYGGPSGIPIGGGGGLPGENPCRLGECETALGSIPTDPADFSNRILLIATSLGGGFAFILMVIGALKVLTSSGDQQKMSAGRDMIVAAVTGLLFIIFSVVILRFIGIDILNLT